MDRFDLEEIIVSPAMEENLKSLLFLVTECSEYEMPSELEDKLSNAILGMIELKELESLRMISIYQQLIDEGKLK